MSPQRLLQLHLITTHACTHIHIPITLLTSSIQCRQVFLLLPKIPVFLQKRVAAEIRRVRVGAWVGGGAMKRVKMAVQWQEGEFGVVSLAQLTS